MSDEHKEKISKHHQKYGVGKWMAGRKLSNETKWKISNGNKGKFISKETRKKLSDINKGKKHSLETKLKISHVGKEVNKNNPQLAINNSKKIKDLWANPNSTYNSKSYRKKKRQNRIKEMKRLGVTTSNYNPKACEYFDILNREKDWRLQHALNGGEVEACGYFLDGYDKERNIVVEYDEPNHQCPAKRDRDIKRQNEIINYLNCQFYRFNEATNRLSNVSSSNSPEPIYSTREIPVI